jgi:hypothetical protein
MVIIAASVVTKSGKALVSRQFVDISRARIEGLLAAFPKLVGSPGGRQHTMVETEAVRYLYHPLESLYLVIVTTKSSNIVEDLDTLHVLAKLVPDYCRSLDEQTVCKQAFELIFAFDEVVAMGYKEKVTVQQVKQFVEMDSQEEKIFEMIQRNKERAAKKAATEKRKELERERREREKMGLKGYPGIGRNSMSSDGMGMGGDYSQPFLSGGESPAYKGRTSGTSSSYSSSSASSDSYRTGSYGTPKAAPAKERKGLQLKKAQKPNEAIEAMVAKGEIVDEETSGATGGSETTPRSMREDVHIQATEKLQAQLDKDGGLQRLQVLGEFLITTASDKLDRIVVKLKSKNSNDFQFRAHPFIDRDTFNNKQELVLLPGRSFPVNTPTAVVKWRYISNDVNVLPLIINCWPTPSKDVTMVTVEYELTNDFEVSNVVIKMPIVAKSPPAVSQAEGTYHFDSKNSVLEWEIPLINNSNKKGNLEFEIVPWESSKNDTTSLFPITVTFNCDKTLCNMDIAEVVTEDGSAVKFSNEKSLGIERYTIE